MNGRLTITDVAKSVGVTPRTIMRWEKAGKIKRSKRDWRGWRFYIKEDVDEIRRFFESSYEFDEAQKAVAGFEKVAIMLALGFGLWAMGSSVICPTTLAESNVAIASAVTETNNSVDINLSQLQVVGAPPQISMEEAVKYTLGPDDVIAIEVRRHPEFSGQYPITSEGKIEYKFVGDILVAGLTKIQLQERLVQILSEYIIEPDVNVQIMAYLSKVFYVVGEVNRPGKFYMKGNTIDVREALMQAGLPNQASSTRKCRLITPGPRGKNKFRDVNVYELLYAGDLKENVEMKPGDVLYVPATVMAKIIRVISPVTNFAGETAGHVVQGAGIAAAGL